MANTTGHAVPTTETEVVSEDEPNEEPERVKLKPPEQAPVDGLIEEIDGAL